MESESCYVSAFDGWGNTFLAYLSYLAYFVHNKGNNICNIVRVFMF